MTGSHTRPQKRGASPGLQARRTPIPAGSSSPSGVQVGEAAGSWPVTTLPAAEGSEVSPPGSADTRSAPSPVPRPPSPAPLRPGLRSAGQPAAPQHPARSPQRVAAVAATPGRAAEGEGRPSRRPPRSRPPPASARLTSSPGGSARRRRRDKSVQLTLRAGGRRSRGPHHPRPPRRAPLSLLGTPPREPPYYGATKLRSLRAFLRSSLPPSLPPSLPRSRLSPHLPLPPPATPPPPPTRWVGTTPSQ